MITKKLGTFALTSLVVLALGAACSGDDDDDDDDSSAETGGSSNGDEGGTSAGTGAKTGSAGQNQGGHAGASGADGTLTDNGGGAGEEAVGSGDDGGAGGGEGWSACEAVRSGLLGPIASVSTGTVEVTSGAAPLVTIVVDASAGGYAAAANNPYIYVNLATKSAVAVSDTAADTSLAWDLAFKRDNIRSNGGDSGAGAAQVAVLEGADFDTVTASAAATADFGSDEFIDHASCDSILDDFGKASTRFAAWYDYDMSTMVLTPADKVYLIRGANGTSLYELQITGYYVDVPNGSGGTVKKSAVYSLTYRAL